MSQSTLPKTGGIILGLFLLLWAASATAGPSIRHHDLHITLDPERGTLEGTDTLLVDAEGATELLLHLAPTTAIVDVRVSGKVVPYVWESGRLAVRLSDGAPVNEAKISVRYSGLFRDPVPEAPLSAEDPTYGVAATILPQGAFLSGGSGWYPDLEGNLATFRLRIETPGGMRCVTSGKLVEHGQKGGKSYSVWQTANPLSSLTLSAGPFRVLEEKFNGIPIATYFYPETENLASGYLRAAKNYIDLYTPLFGAYPFEKFAVVENFFPTGYGFPSWTLIGSSVVRLPFIVETSLGHEIAHSWWGNGVQVNHEGGNWSEGLTTYVADHLYQERSSPEAGREYRLKILRDYATLVASGQDYPLNRFISRRTASDQAIGYGKGAMVFHMVRRLVGDRAFWRGLRELAREKMFRPASWEDFTRVFSRASGKSLDGFFHQWLEREGAPALHFEEIGAARKDGRWRISGTLVQDGAPYEIRVPLLLETTGRKITEVITCSSRKTPFTFDVADPPLRLVGDPDVDLFRRLAQAEIPPTINGIRGSDTLRVIVAAGTSPETVEASRLLLEAMRQDAPLLREDEATDKDLSGHDILFIGRPEKSGWLKHLPEGLSLAGDAIHLNAEVFSRRESTLFAAIPHPSDPKRIAALFVPASPEAARETARKIPHYGKYSFLLFSNGINKAKGVWPVTGSPLIHKFISMEAAP